MMTAQDPGYYVERQRRVLLDSPNPNLHRSCAEDA
jgi:hypothetical protein